MKEPTIPAVVARFLAHGAHGFSPETLTRIQAFPWSIICGDRDPTPFQVFGVAEMIEVSVRHTKEAGRPLGRPPAAAN